MTKVAYLECPTGIAGDMCLGALIHAGVPLEYFTDQLNRLGIANEYKLWTELVHRNSQQATQAHVDLLVHHSIEDGNSYTTFAHHSDPGKLPPAHSHLPERHHPHQPLHLESHVHDHLHEPSHQAGSQHGNRHLPEIESMIQAAGLPPRVEAWSLAIFHRLAEAEGAVHGIPPEQVHFHEVGATDAIVDIVGTCLGLDWLNIEQLYCSTLPTGGGTVRAAHGLLPVPTPAVLKLYEMRQVPIYSNGIDRELVTPTGAAIVTTLATQFGDPPTMTLHQVGLGAGSRNLPIPNILRLWIGERESGRAGERESGRQGLGVRDRAEITHSSSLTPHFSLLTPSLPHSPTSSPPHPSSFILHPSQETISVLETQIDDLNPQAIGYVFEALFAVGALDVFTQAIGMKKSRPGILLTVICHPEQVQACEAVLFQETTTLGIRHSSQPRTVLQRELQTVQTSYGTVRIKVARREVGGAIVNVHPEYEDCARLARQVQQPWREIHRLALQTWYQKTTVKPGNVPEPMARELGAIEHGF
ncbi:MAG: nickel pincer cofactor biosynthesis protein LarC [Cyanobacteria bacterium RU_5_0]|nr:nickel pincer cofactor biosynthesis protein LarC [Cyanobacteria bacterium RU_5_0]